MSNVAQNPFNARSLHYSDFAPSKNRDLRSQSENSVRSFSDGVLFRRWDTFDFLRNRMDSDTQILENPEKFDALSIVIAVNKLKDYISGEDIELIGKIAQTHTEPEVRAACVAALKGEQGQEILKKATVDESPMVRKASVARMTEIDRENSTKVFEENMIDLLKTESDNDVLVNILDYFEQSVSSDEQNELIKIAQKITETDNLVSDDLVHIISTLSQYSGYNREDVESLILQSSSFQKMEPQYQDSIIRELDYRYYHNSYTLN